MPSSERAGNYWGLSGTLAAADFRVVVKSVKQQGPGDSAVPTLRGSKSILVAGVGFEPTTSG
jgi:hypothetical protein